MKKIRRKVEEKMKKSRIKKNPKKAPFHGHPPMHEVPARARVKISSIYRSKTIPKDFVFATIQARSSVLIEK